MTSFEQHIANVISIIESAFNGIELEDGISLHEANLIDLDAAECEIKEARKLDTVQHWQDVPDESIFDCCSALTFLDKKGFRFYLPAFMRASLKYFKQDPNDIRNLCEWRLTDRHLPKQQRRNPSQFSNEYGFTHSQIKAIAAFLRTCADFDDCREGQKYFELAVQKWEQLSEEQDTP